MALNEYVLKYEYLIGLRRRDWAWEFVRRCPEFAEEAYARWNEVQFSTSCIPNSKVVHLYESVPEAERWGLMFFPNPDQPAPTADVYWLADFDPAIVSVMVTPRNSGEPDEMKAVIDGCSIDVLRDPNGTEHLLTRGKYSSAQSLCSGLSLLHARQPVKVNLDMRGPGQMDLSLAAYKQAEEILHKGPWRWTSRTLRLRNALICLDVKEAGLQLRDAAEMIYGEERVANEWSGRKQLRDQLGGFYKTGQKHRSATYRSLLKGGPLDAMV